MKNYKAKFVTSVTVIDPDSGGEVNVEIYNEILESKEIYPVWAEEVHTEVI